MAHLVNNAAAVNLSCSNTTFDFETTVGTAVTYLEESLANCSIAMAPFGPRLSWPTWLHSCRGAQRGQGRCPLLVMQTHTDLMKRAVADLMAVESVPATSIPAPPGN